MLYQSLFPCITEDFVPLRLPVLQPANSHTHRRTFGLFPLRAIRDRAALNNPALASVWMYTHFRLSGSHTREVVTAGLALQDKVSVLERLRRPALRSLPLPVAMLPILTSTWRCHSIFILALLAGEGGQESIFLGTFSLSAHNQSPASLSLLLPRMNQLLPSPTAAALSHLASAQSFFSSSPPSVPTTSEGPLEKGR